MTTIDCSQKIYRNAGNISLLNILPKSKGRVLDCGCGAGDNAHILNTQGWAVTGITISPLEQQIASSYCEKVYLADLDHGIPENVGVGFDLVLMSHILEHLIHPERLIEDSKHVLNPNGMIAVALPNVLAYRNRLRFLFGKFEYESGGVMDGTHVRFYTFSTGAELLRSNGYHLILCKADGSLPFGRMHKILPAPLVEAMNHWACHWWPGLFGLQSLYLAEVQR